MRKKAPGRALGCGRDIWAHPRVPAGRHPHTLRCGKGAWARTLSSEGNIPRQRHSNLINFDPRRVAGGPPEVRRGAAGNARRDDVAHPRVPAGRHPHTLRCGKGAWARTLSSEGNIPRQRHSNLINFDPKATFIGIISCFECVPGALLDPRVRGRRALLGCQKLTKHYSPKEHICQILTWQGETWNIRGGHFAITNSILGIKSRFFAQTLIIMSGTSTKIFRNFFDPEVFIFIFQMKHNWVNRKKKTVQYF